MIATLKLAARNLLRYRRRTLLTALLITIGVVAMLLFVAAAGSFKQVMSARSPTACWATCRCTARLRRVHRQPAAQPEPGPAPIWPRSTRR
jgi:hypothetical protein